MMMVQEVMRVMGGEFKAVYASDGSQVNDSNGERQMKLHSLAHCSLPAVRPRGWGPLL